MTEEPGHFALVIGIDHYPKFRSLQGACKDAQDFYDWLIDPERGGVPARNVAFVLSTPDPARPIHDDIEDAVERLLTLARVPQGSKRLYVYFSGHGLGTSNLGTNLCLAKWSKMRLGYALNSEKYRETFMRSGYFREVIFLLDCCRVRQAGAEAALAPVFGAPPPGDDASAARSFVGYATEFMNAAYEADTGRTEGDVRGHFTQALLKALNGEAAEPGGGVRASKLKEYLEVNTRLIAQASSHTQNPEIVNGFDASTDPLIGHAKPVVKASSISVRITFPSVISGDAVVEDGQLQELKRGDVTTAPWHISVTGRTALMVRHLSSGKEKLVRIQGSEMEEIHVEL